MLRLPLQARSTSAAQRQAASWMREIFEQRLLAAFKGGKRAARHFKELEDKVRAGKMTASAAAHELGRLAGIKDAE